MSTPAYSVGMKLERIGIGHGMTTIVLFEAEITEEMPDEPRWRLQHKSTNMRARWSTVELDRYFRPLTNKETI